MNILFLSYDGMTDSLGQSQVIPYLIGLSEKGCKITIVSFEKKMVFYSSKDKIKSILDNSEIQWYPIFYTYKPPVISTVFDLLKLFIKVHKLSKNNHFNFVHCRSYITSIIGLYFKKHHNIKFIFDMRAFYADERIESGLWKKSNRIYYKVYQYFKKKEIQFLANADYTICLTESAKKIIHSWNLPVKQPMPISVISCCADLQHFSAAKVNINQRENIKLSLAINDDDFVLSYLGSLGTWYLLDEMLEFFKRLLIQKPNAKFLFITPDNSSVIKSKANLLGIDEQKIIVRFAARNEVPLLLSLSTISIFFIIPCFSKKASSPTKHGEILGMGIPVICNSGIGDVDEIVNTTKTGLLVNSFSDEEYDRTISKIDNLLLTNKEKMVNAAKKYYSLEKGIQLYYDVYKKLMEE